MQSTGEAAAPPPPLLPSPAKALGGRRSPKRPRTPPPWAGSPASLLAGNAPPWTVKAKGAYLARAAGVAPGWALPRDLVALTQTTPALRALLFVKAHHPARVLHAALLALFGAFWTSPHARLADDDALAAALVAALVASGALADNEVRRALAGRADFKDALAAETRRAAELGAFGAPCRLTRPVGTFGQIYERLGVAHRSVEVLEPPARL